MSSTYIKVGTRVRVYDGSVTTNDHLEVGTYKVDFNPNDGYSLVQTDDLTTGTDKVYGTHERKVAKVFNTYHRHGNSLGVMLSGDKGQGKTLFLRMLSEKALYHRLPVVLVNAAFPGIANFLDTLGECMIVFDEFEKVFPRDHGEDGDNFQNQFLPLFDGASRQKRLYCITVNQVHDLSEYLHNRPGRFHYHLRFEYPGADAIREYLVDQSPEATPETVEAAVRFANQAKINYDHLRAIALEINNDPTIPFEELIEDLNIKNTENLEYTFTVLFNNGETAVGTTRCSLSHDQAVMVQLHSVRYGRTYVTIELTGATMNDAGNIILPAENLNIEGEYSRAPEDLKVVSITVRMVGQRQYAHRAF